MTLAQQVGRLFMIGFPGRAVSRELAEMISTFGIGGVILFDRNLGTPAEIAALTNDLQSRSPASPLFISVDQEGGRVARLKAPFTQFPPAAVLGASFAATRSVQYAYRFGEVVARELKAVGLNMDLAPVLDVHTNPANPVIGDRALGADPHIVSELGLAMIAGFQDNGVIACGKHYPGHGDTTDDSHTALPRVAHDIDRLSQVEMKPFVHAIRNGLICVMTAHVLFTALDPVHPATVSEKILRAMLRKVLGYRGLIITDDLEMKGIESLMPVEDAAVEALQAGADIPLICHSHEKQVRALEAVIRAVESGRLSREAVDAAGARVAAVKNRFLRNRAPVDPAAAAAVVGCGEHQDIAGSMRVFQEDSTRRAVPARRKKGRKTHTRGSTSTPPPAL